MPLPCFFTNTCFVPGWGCGTSLICHELLTAGTTAAFITLPPNALRCERICGRCMILGARIANRNPGRRRDKGESCRRVRNDYLPRGRRQRKTVLHGWCALNLELVEGRCFRKGGIVFRYAVRGPSRWRG